MARPYTKDPWRDKRLSRYVGALLFEADNGDLLASSDPKIRLLGAVNAVDGEPRPWKLRKDVFRDFLLLPAIERTDGPEVVEALRAAPRLLDEFVDLKRGNIHRDTPNKQRLARERDVAWLVTMVMLGGLYDGYDPKATYNANLERAVDRVGTNRHAIARVDRECRRAMGRLSEPERNWVPVNLINIIELMRELDRREIGPSVRVAEEK